MNNNDISLYKPLTKEDVILNPLAFAYTTNIRNKDGFKRCLSDVITPEQIDVLRILNNKDINKVAILKSRQIGISTIIRAYMFWAAYFTKQKHISAVFSNKEKGLEPLISMDKYFYGALPRQMQRPLIGNSKIELKWSSGGIMGFSGSAQNDRGFSFANAHLSEYAFMENADDILKTVIPSVGSTGKLVVESTPNSYGDAMHDIFMQAQYNSAWTLLFFPWYKWPAYSMKVKQDWKPDQDELVLMNDFNLSLEQIYWRRNTIDSFTGDLDKFRREYPMTVDEAYSLTSANYFSGKELENINVIDAHETNGVTTLISDADIKWGTQFVIGVDPAQGVGGDYSVAYVMDSNTREPILVYSSNKDSIGDFAETVVAYAKHYKNARICYEENNHGHAFRQKVNSLYYSNVQAFQTNTKTKLALFDKLRQHIHSGLLTEVERKTFNELKQLVKKDGLAPTHPKNAHDDRVLALCLALYISTGSSLTSRQFSQPNKIKQMNSYIPTKPLSIL